MIRLIAYGGDVDCHPIIAFVRLADDVFRIHRQVEGVGARDGFARTGGHAQLGCSRLEVDVLAGPDFSASSGGSVTVNHPVAAGPADGDLHTQWVLAEVQQAYLEVANRRRASVQHFNPEGEVLVATTALGPAGAGYAVAGRVRDVAKVTQFEVRLVDSHGRLSVGVVDGEGVVVVGPGADGRLDGVGSRRRMGQICSAAWRRGHFRA